MKIDLGVTGGSSGNYGASVPIPTEAGRVTVELSMPTHGRVVGYMEGDPAALRALARKILEAAETGGSA